jgi:hypothetical protein
VVSERGEKLSADMLRTATVMRIKQDALEAAAKAAQPRRKRVIMVVPGGAIGRISGYLVRRCFQSH